MILDNILVFEKGKLKTTCDKLLQICLGETCRRWFQIYENRGEGRNVFWFNEILYSFQT